MLFSYRYYLIRFYKICLDILYESLFFLVGNVVGFKEKYECEYFFEIVLEVYRGDYWFFEGGGFVGFWCGEIERIV